MAEGFARRMGLQAESVGATPATRVTDASVAVMKEKGIDISTHRPRGLDRNIIPGFDRVIVIGSEAERIMPGLPVHEHWALPDPLGRDLQTYRGVRDRLAVNVRKLVDAVQQWHRA